MVPPQSLKSGQECKKKKTSCCSDAEYAAALEDIPETGDTFCSLYPPSFSYSAVLTDLNMELILTNGSWWTYLCSLEFWIISGSLTFDNFITCIESSSQHTSWVSCAPVLILKLIYRGPFAKERSCLNNNSSGARNNSIESDSPSNIIFNKYIIFVLHIGLKFIIEK